MSPFSWFKRYQLCAHEIIHLFCVNLLKYLEERARAQINITLIEILLYLAPFFRVLKDDLNRLINNGDLLNDF